jgi:hypothetical protein
MHVAPYVGTIQHANFLWWGGCQLAEPPLDRVPAITWAGVNSVLNIFMRDDINARQRLHANSRQTSTVEHYAMAFKTKYIAGGSGSTSSVSVWSDSNHRARCRRRTAAQGEVIFLFERACPDVLATIGN